jgi:protein-S-isoprenylcysteine O-methyltransferase Ste14
MPHATVPLVLTNPIAAGTFWIAYVIWAVPEFLGSFRQRSSVTGATTQDRGSYFVVVGSMYVGLFIAFLAAFGVPDATITWLRGAVFAVGVVLMLLGVALRWWAIRMLGRFFTRDVATRGDQVVVQNGPYRFIRHPAYSGTLLTVLGIGVALTNWVSIVAAVAFSLAGHLYRVRIEEAALRKALGKPYEDYMRRTRRFIPFVL